MAKTARPKKPNPKSTDSERHKRFVDMAHEMEASNDPRDFEKAFKKVALQRPASGKNRV